jgi:hypothetical protein
MLLPVLLNKNTVLIVVFKNVSSYRGRNNPHLMTLVLFLGPIWSICHLVGFDGGGGGVKWHHAVGVSRVVMFMLNLEKIGHIIMHLIFMSVDEP